MSVFVDDCRNPFGRMQMCHMIADTTQELLTMVRRIGVGEQHIQFLGSYQEHFDICQSKRRLAISCGALEISRRALVKRMLAKRLA